MTFWCPNGLFSGLGKGSKTVLGSTHVVEQLSFSVLPSILTFDFDLIFGLFLIFWGPKGLFFKFGYGMGVNPMLRLDTGKDFMEHEFYQ